VAIYDTTGDERIMLYLEAGKGFNFKLLNFNFYGHVLYL
jgi:hypothetical protein